MYNHNKAQQSKNRVHISWDILYHTQKPHTGLAIIYQQKGPLSLELTTRITIDTASLWPATRHI